VTERENSIASGSVMVFTGRKVRFPLKGSRGRDLRIPIGDFMLSRANHRLIAVLSVPHDDPTMQRLEDQIRWYDARSNKNQRWFKTLKASFH
jgi:hypothetical protein